MESELFGHERGAFTGADRLKIGKFELAGGGTLFLDEIGELPLAGQTKLLRVLQEREIERVGGMRPLKLDVRIIAATNRQLDKMVAAGTFRQDFYYRLNVFPIRTPSLRERREDIPDLARHFASKYGSEAERAVTGIAPEVLAIFQRHRWPGNVRELENVVHRAMLMGEAETILPSDLPSEFIFVCGSPPVPGVRNFADAIDQTARELCIHAFTVARGNCRVAAELLGLHRNSVYRLIRRLGLNELTTFASSKR
jgi:transcriptional regulator with GAF, ATPase, and Fis domain